MIARPLALSLLVMACATVAPPPPDAPRTAESYEAEVINAAEVAAAEPEIVVRYNPVRCSCPPFEVQLGARWVRVKLAQMSEPASLAATLLKKAKQARQARQIPHYPVRGQLGTSTYRCSQGAVYLEFEPGL